MTPRTRHRPAVRRTAASLVIAVCVAQGAHAAGLETYVVSVAGRANTGAAGCSHSGLTAGHTMLFGASSGTFVPLPGAGACGLAGGHRLTASPTGPLADGAAATTTWESNTFTGSADARASYGRLGSRAQVQTGGPSDGSTYKSSEAYALLADTFTLHSASVADGTAGKLVFRFDIDGHLSTTAVDTYSVADVNFSYAVGDVLRVTLMHAQLSNTLTPATKYVDPFAGNDLSGFVDTPGLLTLDTSLRTRSIDFVFGTPFDFTLGLQAWTIGSAPLLNTVVADFHDTASFAGLQVTDALGRPLDDLSIVTASGTDYFAPAVPEPASAVLLVAGLAGLLALRGRRVRRTVVHAAIAVLGVSAVVEASAQTFPSRTVRITTPFPAGSGPDAALRLVADQLQKKWAQPVVVENKPGGNGFIAVAAFKQGRTTATS